MGNYDAKTLDDDSVIVRAGEVIVSNRQGPWKTAFENVVGDIVIDLVDLHYDPQGGVLYMDASHDVALRARRLKFHTLECVLESHALEVNPATVHFKHI